MGAAPSIRGALYRELYDFFTRAATADGTTMSSARDLPRPLARGLAHFLSLLQHQALVRLEEDLADLTADAVSQWFAVLWSNLAAEESDDPQPVPRARPRELATIITGARARYPDDADRWAALSHRLAVASLPVEYAAISREVESQLVVSRRRAWEQSRERAFRAAATPLADHLNETLPLLADLDRTTRRVFQRAGDWDVFDDRWREIDWSLLEAARRRLDAEPDTGRVAESIARGPASPEPRSVWREIEETTETIQEREIGPGRVLGLAGGSAIPLALPSELALLATPETEDLFAQKLADQGVLGLRSEHRERRAVSTSVQRWRRVAAPTRLGPLVLCLDTSGSMDGTPETVASALILGLARAALPLRRPLSILAVRGGLREVAITPDADEAPVAPVEPTDSRFAAGSPSRIDQRAIEDLAAFLAAPTTAGADVSPALAEALSRIGELDGVVADLVVVSDMRIPRLSPNHQRELDRLHRAGVVSSHAVTIGDAPMHDPLHTFDYHWHYSTRDGGPSGSPSAGGMLGFRTRL